MSTNTTKNNGQQQTNVNRSSYVHLLAGGYKIKEEKNLFYIRFIYIVLLVHLVLY